MKILEWLTVQLRGWRMFRFIILLFLVDLALSLSIGVIYLLLGVQLPDTSVAKLPLTAWYAFPVALAIMALEEFLFRFMPLTLAIKREITVKKVVVLAIIASTLFGLWHGSYHFIFIQGIGGFLYCVLFLKVGGYERKFIKAGLICLSVHIVFNFVVALLVYSSGGTTMEIRLPFDIPFLPD